MPKKKQHDDSSPSKRAKITIELEPSRAADHPQSPPIVCSFPSGDLPNDAQFRVTETAIVGRDDTCDYYGIKSSSSSTCRARICVGVYDKRRHILRLQRPSDPVVPLFQSVRGYPTTAATTTMTNTRQGLDTAAAQYQALFRDFGSAKKAKALKSKAANRISERNVVGVAAGSSSSQHPWTTATTNTMSESNRIALERRKAEIRAAANVTTSNTTTTTTTTTTNRNDDDEEEEQPNTTTTATMTMCSHLDAVERATQAWRTSFLPPYNESAKSPHDVYRLETIAGPDACTAISRIVVACRKKQQQQNSSNDRSYTMIDYLLLNPNSTNNIQEEQDEVGGGGQESKLDDTRKPINPWCPCIREILETHLTSLTNGSNTSDLEYRCQCAILLNGFIQLYKTFVTKRHVPAPEPQRKRHYFGQSIVIAERFLELFAVEDGTGRYTMTKAGRDKCRVYLYVLHFLTTVTPSSSKNSCSSPVDLSRLTEELQVDRNDAMQLLRLAGCTVQKANNNKNAITAKLTLPLTFPKNTRGGGKQRK